MLGRLAAARGVAYAETLTGFKWIARAALDRPDLRFVYGYEEALGSCVGTLVRDKDGITAALAFAELVGRREATRPHACSTGSTTSPASWASHATAQRSVRFEGSTAWRACEAAVDALAASPPATLAGVAGRRGRGPAGGGQRLPPTDGVVLRARRRRA